MTKTLTCKTGISLNHIIDKQVNKLKQEASEQTDDLEKQKEMIQEKINEDLLKTRDYANYFTTTIEKYYEFKENCQEREANYAQAWLRGDTNIPATEKRKFGVQVNWIKKMYFLILMLSLLFLISIGYVGLVILIDEAKYIMETPMQKSRDAAYNYI